MGEYLMNDKLLFCIELWIFGISILSIITYGGISLFGNNFLILEPLVMVFSLWVSFHTFKSKYL